jgi:hypothetical protein
MKENHEEIYQTTSARRVSLQESLRTQAARRRN